MSDIVLFLEEDHSYWLHGERMTSATTFIGGFAPEYEHNYWVSYKAVQRVMGEKKFKDWKKKYFKGKRHPNLSRYLMKAFQEISITDYEIAREAIGREWRDKNLRSTTKGTQFHKKMEDKFLEEGVSINPFTEEEYEVITWDKTFDNESYPEGMDKMPDGFYPEALLFNAKWRIAGQADMLWIKTIDDKRYFWVDDFKTNEKKPGPKESYFNMYREPIEYLPCSKYNAYSLQSSLYSYMLEEEGFIRADSAITHITNYDESTADRIPVPYLKDEIKAMLKYQDLLG